jgi:hypothetical protein
MRKVTLAIHTMAAAVVLSAPSGVAGQQAPSFAGNPRFEIFVKAHVAIDAARDAFHRRIAANHNEEANAEAREELAHRIAEILEEADITQEEFDAFTLSVSSDPETRAAFDAAVAALASESPTATEG